MTLSIKIAPSGKKMAIITGFFEDETYGLLGPQMAATIIQDHTPYECIVIAVTREYDTRRSKEQSGRLFWHRETGSRIFCSEWPRGSFRPGQRAEG